jgi:hypothetical protein
VKQLETIVDNLSEAGLELGLSVSRGFSRANGLDCRCTSRRRKAFRCAADEKLAAFLELESAIRACGELV